ncbi:hypothetical protein AX15_000718 [Amanita polypyramis BW_CC]|nr:hypothetical protein AX15_000718 [Amanita polypyramis BW_CC]
MSRLQIQQRPRFAIATLSLGTNARHYLPTKIRVASQLKYEGVEMFMPDFEVFVQEVKDGQHRDLFAHLSSFSPESFSQRDLERTCATALSLFCKKHHLQIPLIQPLRNFENFTTDEQIDVAVDAAERWFDLMPYFGTDLMLVCSNFIEDGSPVAKGSTTMDAYLNMQIRAFRRLGERAVKYGVRVGYEPLAWGTVVDNWIPVWHVVSQVDMPNVGIILDSFNTLGNQYADPCMENSLKPCPFSTLLDNLALMSRTIPGDKIFFYQIGDAHRPEQPIMDKPDAPARMTWSRASRLFPCEIVPDIGSKDAWKYIGFLPVIEMTRAVLATGYKGWWSLEVFNKSLQEEDEGCPWRHGTRGIDGLHRLWNRSTEQSTPTGTLPLMFAQVPAWKRGAKAISWILEFWGLPSWIASLVWRA